MIYHNRIHEFLNYHLGVNINLQTKHYTTNYSSIKYSIYLKVQEDKNEDNKKNCEENSVISNSHVEYHHTYVNIQSVFK